ncbi:MAG TPA: hypothetical protein PKL21_04270 [Anaerolineaceae bacterium]|nr:hypothetical protein [Anaerolineaceae bacterium]
MVCTRYELSDRSLDRVIEKNRLCPAESDQSVLHGRGITLPARHSHRPLKKPPYHSDLARIHNPPDDKTQNCLLPVNASAVLFA